MLTESNVNYPDINSLSQTQEKKISNKIPSENKMVNELLVECKRKASRHTTQMAKDESEMLLNFANGATIIPAEIFNMPPEDFGK